MKANDALGQGPWILGLLWLGLHGSEAPAKDRFREELHKTLPLAADGRLRLENVNGAVRITTWDRAEIQVDAVKQADTKAELDKVQILIDAKPNRVGISTKYPNTNSGWRWWQWNRSAASVDYRIQVPAGVGLEHIRSVNGSIEVVGVRGDTHVSSVNGQVRLDGVGGKVDATTVNGRVQAKGLAGDGHFETVNGAIEAVYQTLAGASTVSLKTVNGGVELTLPLNADADVSGHTLNGGIHTDPGLTVKKNWPVGKDLQGRLGKGTTRIRAETVNGGIRVHNPVAQTVQAERPE